MCRDWAIHTVNGETLSDRIIGDWCAKHTGDDVDDPTKSDEACRCHNRTSSKALKPLLDAMGRSILPMPEAACWYGPCAQDKLLKRYLVTSDERKATCPDFCANIINVIDSNNIDMSHIELVNDCSQRPATCPQYCVSDCPSGCLPNPPPPVPPPGPKPKPEDPEWLKWLKLHKRTAGIVGGGVVAAVVGLVLLRKALKK
jgi:hypothetical protein